MPRPSTPSRGALGFALLLMALGAGPASAQIYVYPRRPTQSDVRYHEFAWQFLDILQGKEAEAAPTWEQGPRLHLEAFESPTPGAAWNWSVPHLRPYPSDDGAPGGPFGQAGGAAPASPPPGMDAPPAGEASDAASPVDWSKGGGVRLYFYERERPVAERAAVFVEQGYRYLVEAFRFVPRETFPYFLYSSYLEFLQTNLFPIQEGVLGVTSPQSLEVTLPYFGDHQRFLEVSTHELGHEFTIQKTMQVAKDAKVQGNPIWRFPLWFIEGLAEFYAQRGLDPEGEMLVRDILVNPVLERGHVFRNFFEDRPYSVLWTYKLGQARCTFLEETYGRGTIQKIIEASPRLLAKIDKQPRLEDFKALVEAVTGDDPTTITLKFERWVKARAFSSYVKARQDAADVKPLEDARDYIQALAAAPDGHLLLYRSIEAETGERRLYLVDDRAPLDAELGARDGVPGIESLHPVSGRSFAVRGNALAFIALDGDSDVVYWQSIRRDIRKVETQRGRKREVTQVEFELGARRRYDLGDRDLIAADSPAFSPDGTRLAFVGLDEDGRRDVYVLTPGDDGRYTLDRLTNDEYAERQLSWGPGGVVYTSDATEHGRYNLFRVDVKQPSNIRRLTFDEVDQFDPLVLPDGRIFFAAYVEHGGANLYQWTEQGVQRRTDVPTGLFDVQPGADNGLWALFHKGGQRWPVRVPATMLLSDPIAAPADGGAPYGLPRRSLEGSTAYDPFDVSNWQPGNVFALFGASASGVFGQVIATAHDRLRNHAVILTLFAFGSFDRTDGDLFYINQEHRTIWGAGVFHDLRFHVDRTFEDDEEIDRFVTDERFYGAEAMVRYPFTRFTFAQGSVAVGGVDYAISDAVEDFLEDGVDNGTGRNLRPEWNAANGATRFQSEASLSLGYNTLLYHYATGPISGTSALLEGTLGTQPFEEVLYETARFDGEHYIRLFGRTHLLFRGGAGATFGSRFGREFFLYSFDTLRGVPFGEPDFLLGRRYFFTTTELQFPLNDLVRIPIIDLEGIIGADFGAVGKTSEEAWDRRVLDLAIGVNFGIGPLVLRLHYAKPFDIGAIATPNRGDWVTNLSLAWRY